MTVFCSLATRETVPQARVLAATLRAHDPGARLVVYLLGGGGELQAGEEFEVLAPDELSRSASLDGEQPSVLTPEVVPARLLEWAFADGAETAVYLSPHTFVHATLEPAVAAARERHVVLMRRLQRLPDDDKRPNYWDLLAAGSASRDFVAAAGGEGQRFARWWAEGIASGGGPSRWLDIAPSVFPTALWLEDPGFGVSFWNLHERSLERRDGAVLVSGRPLRFVEFAGFRPDRPYLLGDYANRVSPLEDPVLAELCGDYAERLRAAGWRAPEIELANERLAEGVRTDPLLRGLWAEAKASGLGLGDESSPIAAQAFAGWLREPAPKGGAGGLNRYLYAVYQSRPDLQTAFGDLDADAEGLVAWAWEQGRDELGLIPELFPQAANGLGAGADAHLTINVFGYLRETMGLAEAARLYVKGLQAASVPVSTTAVAPDLPVDLAAGKTITRFGHHAYEEVQAPFEPAFNLVCLNGDQLTAFMRVGGGALLGDRVTIGNWGWETDVIPPSWVPGFQYVDEIWVYSTYVAQNLARLSPVPVIVIPQPIEVPDPTGVEIDLIREGDFTFLFMFDYFSTLQRKNPLGVIDAFKRAFAPGDGPRLLLKTINADFRRPAADEVRARVDGRRDIELVDRYLDSREIAALIASADCYISLHRSEGFGLTLADSMLLGTPVIATGFSGNMDFTNDRNSYLVDWTLTTVGPGSEIYPPEGTWAEPDIDHAAALMRHVWEHPDEAAEKAARARVDVERQYSPAAAGRVARARLEKLLELRRDGPQRVSSHALSTIEQALTLDLRRGVPSRRSAAGPVRHAMMRLMLPFTVHERNLDRAVLDALRELRADLDRERARGARARARLRRVEERVDGPPELST